MIIFNIDTGLLELLKFLRLNNINIYNKNIGNIDIIYQLRGNYKLDKIKYILF